MISLPLSKQAFENEIIQIEKIAVVNNLQVNVRLLVKRKVVRKLLTEQNTAPPARVKKRWIRISYFGRLSEMLGRNLRRLGYSPAFYPVTTLSNLSKLKYLIQKEDKAGVYKITCGQCPATYIGQTGRPLLQRFREHYNATYSQNPGKSAVGLRCVAFGHDPDLLSVKLLHTCKKSSLMNCLEESEILRHHNTNSHFF